MLLEGIGVGVGPEMNKFEQVSSDHNQMSLAEGRSSGLMSMEGKGYLACHLSHDKFDVTYYPPCRQNEWRTDACKNITFSQLCGR